MIPIGPSTLEAVFDGVRFKIFTYRPGCSVTGIVFIFHGQSRNARDYRDFAIDLAETEGVSVIVPYFDDTQFSTNAYQRGNITDSRFKVRHNKMWSTRFVPMLIDWATANDALPFWMWGFSAGGQFLSRATAFEDIGSPQRIVIASPSSHVLPVLGKWPDGEAAPYGMGGVFVDEEAKSRQRAYLAQPVTLYVGAEDLERPDPSLASSRAAQRQGEDRVKRARNTFALGQEIAQREEWAFNWRLIIEPGVGHSASDLLTPDRAAYVLGLGCNAQA